MAINFIFSTRATDRGLEHYAQVQGAAGYQRFCGYLTSNSSIFRSSM